MRKPYEIALDIKRDWTNISPAAKPYTVAMGQMKDFGENYYLDSGESVILYFLANAGTWRGEVARRVKAELKQILQELAK